MKVEVPPGAMELVARLLAHVSCPACKKSILEPQKGICGHDACAKCWATHKRKCVICKKCSGMKELHPNTNLAATSLTITKFIDTFQSYFKITVESNGSTTGREISTPENEDSEECFIDRDIKYSNMNTYNKKAKQTLDKSINLLSISQNDSPLKFIGESVDKIFKFENYSDPVKGRKKVAGWLNNADNNFARNPKLPVQENSSKLSPSNFANSTSSKSEHEIINLTSNDLDNLPDKKSNLADNSVLKNFFDRILPNKKQTARKSTEINIHKDNVELTKMKNKKIWEPVKKMEKVLKKPAVKKLNVSIEPYVNTTYTKSDQNTSYELPNQFKIDSIESIEPQEVVVSRVEKSLSDTSIPALSLEMLDSNKMCMDKDHLAYLEVLRRSKLDEERRRSGKISRAMSENIISIPETCNIFEIDDIHSRLKSTIKNMEINLENESKLKLSKFSDGIEPPSPSTDKKSSQVISSILNDFNIEDNLAANGNDPNVEEDVILSSNSFSSEIIKPPFKSKKTIEKNNVNREIIKSNLSQNRADNNYSHIETKTINVPFLYQSRLHKPVICKPTKTVPFHFMTNSSSEKWQNAPQNGIDIKIKNKNVITSIIVRNELCDTIVKTRDAQTSPIHFNNSMKENESIAKSIQPKPAGTTQMDTYDINDEIICTDTDELCKDNLGFGSKKNVLVDSSNVPEIRQSEPSHSKTMSFFKSNKGVSKSQIKPIHRTSGKIIFSGQSGSQILLDNPNNSMKRYRKDIISDGMNNDSEIAESQTKKSKYTVPETEMDDEMVVNFQSQSQSQTKSKSSESDLELTHCIEATSFQSQLNQDSNIKRIDNKLNTSENTIKLNQLKMSVDLYQGGSENDVNGKKMARTSKAVSPNIFESKKSPEIENIDKQTIPESPNLLAEHELCTPADKIDSDNSIVEDTPQKDRSIRIIKKRQTSVLSTQLTLTKENVIKHNTSIKKSPIIEKEISSRLSQPISTGKSPKSDINLRSRSSLSKLKTKNLDTPSSLKKFTNNIRHQSTPLIKSSKRSLTYDTKDNQRITEVEEISYTMDCEEPTQNKDSDNTSANVKTLERDFMVQAFEATSEMNKSKNIETNPSNIGENNDTIKSNTVIAKTSPKVCLSCSCLSVKQKELVKMCAKSMSWSFSENFTQDVSHLIVRVDEDNKSQRSLKYVQALASGAWVLSYKWIINCQKTISHVKEDDYIALDSSGLNGPQILKMTGIKLFKNMSFFCLPPFSEIPQEILENILIQAGGTVVSSLKEIEITDPSKVSLLIAQPENTQEARFMDLCMEYAIVPVNMEWVLDCLGRGSCNNIGEWIMASRAFLPKIEWSADLISNETNESFRSP